MADESQRETSGAEVNNGPKRKPRVPGTGAHLCIPDPSAPPQRGRGDIRVEIEDWVEIDGTTTYEVTVWRWDPKTIEEDHDPIMRFTSVDEAFAAARAAWPLPE